MDAHQVAGGLWSIGFGVRSQNQRFRPSSSSFTRGTQYICTLPTHRRHPPSPEMTEDLNARRALIERLVEMLRDAGNDEHYVAKDERFRPLNAREIRRLAARWPTTGIRALVNGDGSECLVGRFGARPGTPYIKRARNSPYARDKPALKAVVVPIRDLLFSLMCRPLLEGEKVKSKCSNPRCAMPNHHVIRC